MDFVEFRRIGGGLSEQAGVLVNGIELERLWRQATGRKATPIYVAEVGPSLEMWGPLREDFLLSQLIEAWVPEGSAPVLTCSCGEFGCGGALATISFDRSRLVMWRDLRTANYEEPVDLGAFTFDRKQYERALRAF